VLLGLTFFERPRGVVITGLWALVDVPTLGIVWAGRQNWDAVVTSEFFFFLSPEQSHEVFLFHLTPKKLDKLS
jgi:hypothetical protein